MRIIGSSRGLGSLVADVYSEYGGTCAGSIATAAIFRIPSRPYSGSPTSSVIPVTCWTSASSRLPFGGIKELRNCHLYCVEEEKAKLQPRNRRLYGSDAARTSTVALNHHRSSEAREVLPTTWIMSATLLTRRFPGVVPGSTFV